jgi:hypothetical protein
MPHVYVDDIGEERKKERRKERKKERKKERILKPRNWKNK